MSHDVLAPPSSPQGGALSSNWRHLLRAGATILAWYCISSSIVLMTKWLFTNHFSFPLTVTTFSNTIASVWAFLFSRHPRFRPEPLTRKQFVTYVLPVGICTGLEIGCSNLALKILSVSFGTILKGGGPIFTFLWGLFFRVETFSAGICVSLTTIALGIALASMGEGQEFQLLGFILQLLASALGGLRWAMTHVLLKSNAAMTPVTAVLYTSPTTALCVLPFALGLESVGVWNHEFTEAGELSIVLVTMTTVATLVFFLLVSEYWLVKATSSLAVSVAGVFKELLTIGGGIFLFSEHVDFLNVVGFTISQLGIFIYIYLRYDSSSHDEYTPASLDEEATTRGTVELIDVGIFDKPIPEIT
jgi:solute carrier family 35 protein C2